MHRTALVLCLGLPLVACGSGESASYDPAELARFRAAIPSASQLMAATPSPASAAASSLVSTTATFPVYALEAAGAINGAVAGMLGLLHTLMDVPPTSYDSATREFLWGPWPATDRYGQVAAYIVEQLPVAKSGDCPGGYHVDPADAASCLPDFHFVYALARGLDTDPTTFTPVIWGGANPDETTPTHGSGVTLWDFEADHAFALSTGCDAETPPTPCDPDVASETFTRGRFVTLYGKGYTEDTTDPADSTFAFDVAVFRDFVPREQPSAAPTDAEYFYGVYASSVSLAFMNLHTFGDIDEPKDGTLEELSVRVADLLAGGGRAEVLAQCPAGTSCSLGGGQASLVECWGPLLQRTFLGYDGPAGTFTEPTGATEAACGAVFENGLDALNIPTLDSIDPALLAKLQEVAENGMP